MRKLLALAPMLLFAVPGFAQSQTQAQIDVNNNTNYSIDLYVDDGPLCAVNHLIPNGSCTDYLQPGTHTLKVTVHSTDSGDMHQSHVITVKAGDHKVWNVAITRTED